MLKITGQSGMQNINGWIVMQKIIAAKLPC